MENIFSNNNPVESGTEFTAFAKSTNGMFLGDCPGFIDSKGEEQVIANYLNVKKVIKASRTVRFVILLDDTSFSAKGDLLRRLVQDLEKYLPNYANHLFNKKEILNSSNHAIDQRTSPFLVLFNKFQEEKKEQLKIIISEMINSPTIGGKIDPNFLELIEMNCLRNDRFLDFSNEEQRILILDEIYKMPSLKYEDLFSTESGSFGSYGEKITIFNQKIERLLVLAETNKTWVYFKKILDYLNLMAEFFDRKLERDQYENSRNKIRIILLNILKEKKEEFKKIINIEKLSSNPEKKIDEFAKAFHSISLCYDYHLREFQSEFDENIKSSIIEQTNSLIENYKSCDENSPKLSQLITFIDLLIEKFKLEVIMSPIFEKITADKAEGIINSISSSNKNSYNMNIIDLADRFNILSNSRPEILVYATIYNEASQKLSQKIDDCSNLKRLKIILNSADNNFDLTNDSTYLIETYEFLNRCINSENKTIDKAKINKILKDYENEISSSFLNLYDSLKICYENIKNPNPNLNFVFTELEKISKSHEFLYFDSLNCIFNKFSELKNSNWYTIFLES